MTDLHKEGLLHLQAQLKREVALKREQSVSALNRIESLCRDYREMLNRGMVPSGEGLGGEALSLVQQLGRLQIAEVSLKEFKDHAHDYFPEVLKP